MCKIGSEAYMIHCNPNVPSVCPPSSSYKGGMVRLQFSDDVGVRLKELMPKNGPKDI